MTDVASMETLKSAFEDAGSRITPASADEVSFLEKSVKLPLSDEYKAYLEVFGTIIIGTWETYGLGVRPDYYLNVRNAYMDLAETEGYPTNALPLMNIDDETYFLYDNRRGHVLTWRLAGDIHDTNETLFLFLRDRLLKSSLENK